MLTYRYPPGRLRANLAAAAGMGRVTLFHCYALTVPPIALKEPSFSGPCLMDNLYSLPVGGNDMGRLV